MPSPSDRLLMVKRFACLLAVCVMSPTFAVAGSVSTQPAGRAQPTVMTIAPPSLTAMPASCQMTIDGKPSEAAWKSVEPAGGFTVILDTSMAAQYPTEVRALWDEENLYFFFECDEPAVRRLVTIATQRDEGVTSDDRVELLIDPTGKGGKYYEFILTAGNVQADAQCESSSYPTIVYRPDGPVHALRPTHESFPEWNAKWQSAVSKNDDKWSAEIAIPFKELGIEGQNPQLMRINVSRVRVTYERSWRGRLRLNRKPEPSVWSPPKGDFHTPALFGFLALADADGKSPPVPEQLKVAVPGLSGMPGVPTSQAPPKLARFIVEADSPSEPLTRFWDSVNSGALEGEFFAKTFAKGYIRQVRCGSGWRQRRSRPTSMPTSSQDPEQARRIERMRAWEQRDPLRFFEVIKEHNISAVVTLRTRPRDITYKSTQNARWGHVSGPPESDADYKLIEKAYRGHFQKLYDRFGKEFFDSLRFEFWNEPDGSERFFAGTVDDYCKWYDHVAKALKEVSPTGKIGGPAVTGGGFDFTKAFLDHCREGQNTATGGKGSPLDFVSFHTYGWRWQLAPMASFDTVNTLVRFWKIMHDAGFGGTETHVTEWGIEPTGNASGPYFWFRKTHYAPVWMAKLVKDFDDATKTYADMKGRIDGLSICLAGSRTRGRPFAGNRTIFIDKWVPKPYFNGYVLLNELGNERLKVAGPTQGPVSCMATRRPDGSLAILVYHFREYARTSPPEHNVTVQLAGVSFADKAVSQMRVDENTSNSYTAWVKMGSPAEITDDIAATLTAAAEVHKLPLSTESGQVELTMPANSVAVVLVEDRETD